MSKVWRARDYNTGKTVALKVLNKEKTEELEARFLGLNKPKEGEIAVQFQHPHIVKTFEHGITTDKEPFLVMEFIEGYSLSYLVEAQNEDMRTNCLKYMIQLGEAIQYFHKENWIHRDICPRNIMVDNEHQLKLIDFGLVVPNTPPFLQPGNRTGTAAYMAPELIKRQKTSQKIDIFSFAVTCYEMLSKRLPWEAAETLDAVLQHINTPPENIQKLLPDLNPLVAEAVMKGLELYPQDRWQTIEEMLEPLKQAYKSERQSRPKTKQPAQATKTESTKMPGTTPPERKSSATSKATRSKRQRPSGGKKKNPDSQAPPVKSERPSANTKQGQPPKRKKPDENS